MGGFCLYQNPQHPQWGAIAKSQEICYTLPQVLKFLLGGNGSEIPKAQLRIWISLLLKRFSKRGVENPINKNYHRFCMTKLFLASKAKRATYKKVVAGVMALALNLSIGGLGGLLLIPQVASAASPDYSITIDEPVVVGNPLTLTGITGATKFVGQESQHKVVIDWGDGSALTEMSVPLSAFSGDGFSWLWSASHPYTNTTTQSYAIIVNICHQSCTGAEGSGDATDTTIVVIPPSIPDTTITSSPAPLTNSTSATFTYTSTLGDSTFECKLDDGAFASCSAGGYTTPVLDDGPHTFEVRATAASVTDPTPATFTWTVDATAPDIDFHADVNAESTSGSGATVTYTSPATTDNVDAPGVATCTPASGSLFPIGSTVVTCNATDVAGNSATPTTFNVIVDANDAPVITLNGLNPMNLILGLDTYGEPGATANDEEDGSGLTVTDITGAVNSLLIGTYHVFYNFIDSGGLAATPVTRTVNVNPGSTQCSDGVDNDGDGLTDLDDPGCFDNYSDDSENEPPVISVSGDNPLEIVVNVGSYTEQGATANDAEDGQSVFPTGDWTVDASAVNVNAVDAYYVTYDFTDTDGGAATQALRAVNVVYGENECNDGDDNDGDGSVDGADSGCESVDDASENTPPEVVIETEMVMLTLHGIFNPPTGVHATDVEDGPLSVEVLGNPVNVDAIGDYIVTYGATDSQLASAAPETQTVQVRAECADGSDNDGDERQDADDPACHTDGDAENTDSYDPTLESESNDPECDDGESNDNDEEVDFGEDEGCSSPSDDSENVPPVIETEMLAMNLTSGDIFVMPVYSAADNEDGTITDNVVVGGDEVDTNTPGVYEVTLDVEDSDGAPAETVTITVTVEEAPQDVCPDDEGVQTSTEECTPPPSPPAPACANGSDDDADGLTDMSDPGCSGSEDNDETDPVAPPPSGGGGGGGGGGGSGVPVPVYPPGYFGTPAPQGEVLGAATTAEEMPLPPGCTAYLNAYLKKGRKSNVPDEVKLLQTFLNEEMNAGLPITGFFGDLTHASVKKFQVKYKKDILQPWIDAGHGGGMDFGNKGTGYVYKTTKRAINMMKCADIAEPMPELVPDTSTN